MAKTVLTVDNSPSMRQLIKMTFSNAGYRVLEAEHGAMGLEVARGTAFDMVLTDLNMPVMDGMVFIRELRKLPSYAGVPIVFVTTVGEADKKAQAKAAGATAWVTKPFEPDQLLSVAKKVLGQ